MPQDGRKIAVSPWMQKVLGIEGGSVDAPEAPYQTVGDYLDSLRPLSLRENIGQAVASGNRALAAIPGETLKGIGVAGSRIAQGVLDLVGSERQVRPPEETEVYKQGQAIEDFSAEHLEGGAARRPFKESLGSFLSGEVFPAAVGMAPAMMTGGAASGSLLVQMTAQQAMSGYAQARKAGADDETAWKAFVWNMPIGAGFLLGPGRQVANLSKALAAVEKETGRSLSRWMLGTAVGSSENAAASVLGDLVGQKLEYGDGVELEKALRAGAVGGALSGFFGAMVEATRAKQPLGDELAIDPDDAAQAGDTLPEGQEPRSPTALAPRTAERAAKPPTAPRATPDGATEAVDAAREATINDTLQRVAAERNYPLLRRAAAETPEQQFFEEWMFQHGKAAVGIEPPAGAGRPFLAATRGDVVVYNRDVDPAALRGAVLYHEAVGHGLPKEAQESLARAAETVDPAGWKEAGGIVGDTYKGLAKAEGVLATYAERFSDWLSAAETKPDKIAALIQHDPGLFTKLVDAIKTVAQRLGIKVQTSLEKKVEALGNLDPGTMTPVQAARLAMEFTAELETLRQYEPDWMAQAPKPPKPAAPPAPAPAPAPPAKPAPAKVPRGTKPPVKPPAEPKAPKPPPKKKPKPAVESVAPPEAPSGVKTSAAPGRTGELVLPTGKPLPVTYRVVDARELVPSHDPTRGFRRNEGGDINERDYSHPVEGRAYRDTVERIAANPRPNLVLSDTPSSTDGPPVVGPGLRVLGGNARSMALQLAYQKGGEGATKLREGALEAAERFGLKREDVESIERPVLVRELSPEHAGEPGEMSRVLNQPLTTAKTANTEAVSRGSKIDEETAIEIGSILDEGTIREALGDPKKTAEITRALVKSGAFTDADVTALMDPQRGLMTQAGRDLVEQSLLGSIVTNLDVLSDLSATHRGTLIRALPHLLRAKAHWDQFGPAFLDALQVGLEGVIDAKRAGVSVRGAKAQQVMPGLDVGWKSNELAVLIAERLMDDTPTGFARRMGVLADSLQDIDNGQGDMFVPGGKKTHEQAIEEALSKQAEREDARGARGAQAEPEAPGGKGGGEAEGQVLFALRAAPRRRRAIPEHDKIERANEVIVESFGRAHTVEAALANPNKRHATIRRTEELMHGKIAAHDEWVKQNYVQVTTRAMREGSIHPSDAQPGKPSVAQYMNALHAPKRNDLMRKRHPRKFGLRANPGSGMSDLEASRIVREAHSSPAAAQYRAIAKANRELNARALDLAVETGLISAKHRATLVQEFGADYVPLKTHYEGAAEYMGAGHSLGVSGKEFKRAEGRITEADNPLVYQIQDKLALARRAEKNRVDLALREAVIRNPNTALWEYRHDKDSIDVADAAAGKVLTFKFGGEERYVVFHDKDLAQAFKSVEKTIAGSAVRVVDTINRWLRGTIIKYNPVWAVVNPIRDLLTAVPKAAAKYGPGFAWDVARNQIAAGIGAFRAMRDPNAKGYWADQYREAAKAGGLVSWGDVMTWADRLKALEAEVERGGSMQTIREAGRMLAALTTASEMGTRLSAYDAATRRGMSRSDAAWIMRNVTVDFARHGSWASVYGRMYLFSGANIQGARSSLEWMRAHPARSAAIVGAMIGMGYALASTSRQLADENESGLNEFDARRDGELASKLGVMVGKTYLGLPMPWFFGQFFNLGRRLEQMHNGRMTVADLSQGAAVDAIQSFSPVQGANILQALTPTFLRPAIELAQNQDFAGRIIYSSPFPTDPTPPPQSERVMPDVNPELHAAARALNRATGGDEINPGKLDINPEWIEHVTKFALGGVGTQGGHALTVAQKIISGEEWSATEIPLVHSFASGPSPGLHKGLFRDNVRDIEYAHETAAAAREKGEPIGKATAALDSYHARARIAMNRAKRFSKAGKDDEALKVMQEFNRTFEKGRE